MNKDSAQVTDLGRSEFDERKEHKRILTAYKFFSQENQAYVRKEAPEASIEEVDKILGQKWDSLTEGEKKPYIKLADSDKTHYNTSLTKGLAAENDTSKTKSIVPTVFIALLIDLFAFTLILPLFPRLLNYYRLNGQQGIILSYASQLLEQFKQLTNKHTGTDKWDTVLLGGMVGSLFSLLQFIVSPIIGRASDRLGRRTVLLYTMIGNLLSTLIWLFAHSFNLFLLARIVAGLSEGNVQLSTAIISDVTTTEKRSKSLALVGIAFAIAFTLGPPIGAWFASIDLSSLSPSLVKFGIYPYSMAAFVGLALLLIETVYIYIKLPETANQRLNQTSIDTDIQQLNLRDIQQRLLTLMSLNRIMGIFSFIFSGMEFTLVFLTFDILDFSHMQQGKLLSYMGIISALIQGGYVRRNIQKFGERAIVIQGMIMCIAGFYCLAETADATHPVAWLYAGVTCLAFTSGTVVSGLTGLASIQCHETCSESLSKGRALGKFRSYGQLGRSLGPISACTLYWIFGPEKCYAVGSLIMMAITWLTVLSIPNKKITKAQTGKSQ